MLCEGRDGKNGLYYGRSRADAPDIDGRVYFSGGEIDVGEIVWIKITGCTEYDLSGELSNIEFSK